MTCIFVTKTLKYKEAKVKKKKEKKKRHTEHVGEIWGSAKMGNESF